MKPKRLFRIFLLLVLLLSTFGNNGHAYASTYFANQRDAVIHDRNLDAWDASYLGYVSSSIYENWQVEFTEYHNFILTVNPIIGDFVPLLIMFDSDGNELARDIGTLISAQPAGEYSIQVQPQTGSGFYLLTLRKVIPSGPNTTTIVSPPSMNLGEMATVTVRLNNIPAEGYTSAEFTCAYEPNALQVSNIITTDLFGVDPAVAINGPGNGHFIVAIAGSQGKKAAADGTIFTFNVKGLQGGQTTLDCTARVSKGDNVLTEIESTPASLTILGSTPTSTPVADRCDKVQFISDVTNPDGTVIDPGATFTKSWRLRNAGSCTWTTAYKIVFVSGNQMGGPESVNFTASVDPGASVIVSLNLTAPSVPGSYRGYWMFENANGVRFGIGAQADKPWWVDIRVAGPSATPGTLTSPPTLSLTPSTVTASPTITPTIPPIACDKAEFIAALNVPPGTVMSPGQQFVKTWRLKNVGTCTWNLSYRIAFWSGEQMGTPSSMQFSVNVEPGEIVNISLSMTAPSTPGAYRGYWIFQNETGGNFGIGPLGNEPWFVDIVVADTTITPGPTLTPSPSPTNTPSGPTSTPVAGVVYDFVASMCTAVWTSGAGQLPCPGIDGNANGFVFKVDQPQLETGTIDTRPALLTFPQNVHNGYIQGVYPAFHVQTGDRFRSTMSCEYGATSCYAAFRLDYQIGSDPIRTFWGPFLERYDGRYYTVDVDLSALAGHDVRFILTTLSAGAPTGDRTLWVGPIIYRPSSGSTPILPVTVTPFISLTPTTASEGTLNGQVFASKPVTINVYNGDDILVQSATVNVDGTFVLHVSSGTYSVSATAPGFLNAQGSVTITNGNTTLPTITLIPGDIDNNHVIDAYDAMTIGMSYNAAAPSAADLNNDGIINVLDLELLARNYRKTGPIAWQ